MCLLLLCGRRRPRDGIFLSITRRATTAPPASSREHRAGQRPGADDRQGPAAGRGGDRIVLAKTGRPIAKASAWRQPPQRHGPAAVYDRRQRRGAGRLGPGAAAAWENYGGPVFRFRPPQMGYQQLFLDDRPAAQVRAPASAGGPPQLRAAPVVPAGRPNLFLRRADQAAGRLPVSYARDPPASRCFTSSTCVIADLTVQAFQLDGINLPTAPGTCRSSASPAAATAAAASPWAGLAGDIDRLAAGRQRRGPTADAALLGNAPPQVALLSHTAPGWVDQGGRVYLDGKRVEGGLDEFHPAAKPGEEAMSRETVGRPMEILLVEDDLEDAGLTIEALKQGEVPCRVSLVRDGEEAMEFLLARASTAASPRPT